MTQALLGFALLMGKHFLGDYVLQGSRHIRGKRSYGARGGVEHAAVHGALTLPCLLILGVAAVPALVAAALEAVVHYHIDWLKERVKQARDDGYDDQGYWILYGADQLAHQLTYVVLLWLML